MRFIDMSDYNRPARIYWLGTNLAGMVAFYFVATDLASMESQALVKLGVLTVIVLIAGFHPVRIPGTRSSFTPGDVFVFLAALLWNPGAAALVAVADATVMSFRTSQRWTSRLASPAFTAVSTVTSASLYHYVLRELHSRTTLGASTALMASLLVFGLAHFAISTLLLATFSALKKQLPIIPFWWQNYCWISVTYAASASAAGLIYLGIVTFGASSLFAAGPLVAVIFAAGHFYARQAEEREKAMERIGRIHLATVEALATAIDAKDEITHDHVYRVQVYACGLARHFKLSDAEIEALKAGALLHDVGKIAVPDYILNKPGKLTAAEFDKMKIHTVVGAQIMERVNFPYPVVPIVRHHHERWDGQGYPDGLRAEQIPITARILTVADCFDAVREDRQYRKGMTREEACTFLKTNAATQFDPMIVDAFLANLPAYEEDIAAHRANMTPLLTPTAQAGLSESAKRAVPAAGLAQSDTSTPDYVKHIKSAHSEVAALYELTQSLSGSVLVKDVLTLTVKQIERTIPFSTCIVYLKRRKDDSLDVAHVFGANADQIRGQVLGLGKGIAGWVVLNGKSMLNTDPMLDLKHFLEESDDNYKTAVVLPLTEGIETIGAIALYSTTLSSYDGGHLHLLELISRLAATALRRALLDELSDETDRLDLLTRLPNTRALYEAFDVQRDETAVTGEPLAAIWFNVAGMSTVNDSYGYLSGDKVLEHVARTIGREIGQAGTLGRIAGDVFVCLARGRDRHQAAELAARAQRTLDRSKIELKPGEYIRAVVNFGVAEYAGNGKSLDDFLKVASLACRRERTWETFSPPVYYPSGSASPQLESTKRGPH